MKAEQSQNWPVVDSNSELSSRVKAFLLARHLPGLIQLGVEACHGTVVLRGRVGTCHERQLAVECCKRVAGVRSVIDGVIVAEGAVLKPPHIEARSADGLPSDDTVTSDMPAFKSWEDEGESLIPVRGWR